MRRHHDEKLHSPGQGGYRPLHPRPPQPNDNWPYHHKPENGNDHQYGYKNPKFERHIYIRKDQIMSDIDMQLDMIAKARTKPDGTEDDRFTNATTQYEGQFVRWIDSHIGIVKGVMSAYLLEKFRTTRLNSISTVDEIDLELRMPEYWDDTVFESLAAAIQNYLVNAVMKEYLVISLTSKDPVTADKSLMADEALLDVKRFANAAKPGRIHKKLDPF